MPGPRADPDGQEQPEQPPPASGPTPPGHPQEPKGKGKGEKGGKKKGKRGDGANDGQESGHESSASAGPKEQRCCVKHFWGKCPTTDGTCRYGQHVATPPASYRHHGFFKVMLAEHGEPNGAAAPAASSGAQAASANSS